MRSGQLYRETGKTGNSVKGRGLRVIPVHIYAIKMILVFLRVGSVTVGLEYWSIYPNIDMCNL